jgi:hypothetical protein
MSVVVSGLIYKIKFGSLAAKAIAVKLADNGNDDGESIFPSKMTIAEAVECSKRTVDLHMDLWLVLGILLIDQLGGGRLPDEEKRGKVRRRGRTSVYAYNMPLLHELAAGTRTIDDLVREARNRGDVDDDGKPRPEAVARIKGAATAPFGGECSDDDKVQPVHRSAENETVQPVHPLAGQTVQPLHPSGGAKGAASAPEPSEVINTPPLPPSGADRAQGGKQTSGSSSAALLERVRRAGVSELVIDRLLRPILDRRRFSDANSLAALTSLGKQADGLTAEALDAAARMVLAAAKGKVRATAIAAAIRYVGNTGADPVRAPWTRWAPGMPAIVTRRDPSWRQWMQHLQGPVIDRANDAGAIKVTSPWPARDSRLLAVLRPEEVT